MYKNSYKESVNVGNRVLETETVYRHFKGDDYFVHAVSRPIPLTQRLVDCLPKKVTHTETQREIEIVISRGHIYHYSCDCEDTLVIYSKTGGKLWARPIEQFMSKLDKKKHPNVDREFRFTPVR